jgi:phosphoribosylanthranilate isomerase
MPNDRAFLVKICGLSTPESVDWAVAAGAGMAGFVHFAPSPRHVDLKTMARLAAHARGSIAVATLIVDADDALLAAIVEAAQPDLLQLHGRETPDRVAAIRARFGVPVMKAVGISTLADVARAADYSAAADWLLLDAKPPKDATRPGGLGRPFDWALLAALDRTKPFMLSGGLLPVTVAEAVARTRPDGVDVSSGVESAPGIKDRALIEAFVAAVRHEPALN